MKKTYIEPKNTVVSINLETLIAESPLYGGSTTASSGNLSREVVRELVAETFSVANIRRELEAILPGGVERERMLNDYEEVHRLLGDSHAPDEAARIMIEKLNTNITH